MHPIAKDIMTIGRIVIIPEFQGFGIGMKLMKVVASMYKGNRIRITTSLKPFMVALNKSKSWKCVRSGRIKKQSGGMASMRDAQSNNRITATFQLNILGDL